MPPGTQNFGEGSHTKPTRRQFTLRRAFAQDVKTTETCVHRTISYKLLKLLDAASQGTVIGGLRCRVACS
jgi:hypothetical protein